MEIINRWKTVKMTSMKSDNVYTTNVCPMCDAESIVQTNACPRCGTILKGVSKADGCKDCAHRHCNYECRKCSHASGYRHVCKCTLTYYADPCPFYEGKSE